MRLVQRSLPGWLPSFVVRIAAHQQDERVDLPGHDYELKVEKMLQV
jgi:hypothetical protein